MTLRHFRIFIEVASAGSITQAARNLYLTQPTVSTAVRELEEHYGTVCCSSTYWFFSLLSVSSFISSVCSSRSAPRRSPTCSSSS